MSVARRRIRKQPVGTDRPAPAAGRKRPLQRLAAAVPSLSGDDLAAITELIVEQAGKRLSPGRALELGARFASCHPALTEREPAIRSLLASVLASDAVVENVAGEPRRVVDSAASADHLMRQARIAGESVAAIWDQELLTSGETARRLGAKPTNREKVNAQRRRSWLLGVPRHRGRQYLYPAFQIDPARREVFSEARKVNQLLDAASDPWGVASWWVSVNGRLDARPMDLLGTPDAGSIVHAAAAMRQPLG